MSDQETVERLRAQGLEVETVGSIMGDAGHGQRKTSTPFVPARLDGTPALPEPGIFFGMSDDEYHALPALSNTGIKKLAASPMIFWASTVWLSEQKRKAVAEAKEKGEREHYTFGKAYHCRLMEGASAYALRYAIKLDPADYPDALESTAQIKAAIEKHEREQPVKPQGKKDEMIEQLRLLDQNAFAAPAEEGGFFVQFADGAKIDVNGLKERIGKFTELAPVKPVSKVPDELPDGTEFMRDAVKADWIAQLRELDPDAEIFAVIEAEYEKLHEGKVFLTPDQHGELEIAALMVARDPDPDVQNAFKHGYAEVVLIWYCPATGVPMKARLDYLRTKGVSDLKTVANQRERSIENAIRFEIGAYKYNIQPVVYLEGVEVVRQLVRDEGARVVFHLDCPENPTADDWRRNRDRLDFAMQWAQQDDSDEWLWVFQQKGAAPITRGVKFDRLSRTYEDTESIVMYAKKRFLTFSEVFGTEPWLDTADAYTIADEDIPPQATEI